MTLLLPLWMNQAKTIWKNPLKFVYDPILPLWMNKARTIQMNPRKIQKEPYFAMVDQSS